MGQRDRGDGEDCEPRLRRRALRARERAELPCPAAQRATKAIQAPRRGRPRPSPEASTSHESCESGSEGKARPPFRPTSAGGEPAEAGERGSRRGRMRRRTVSETQLTSDDFGDELGVGFGVARLHHLAGQGVEQFHVTALHACDEVLIFREDVRDDTLESTGIRLAVAEGGGCRLGAQLGLLPEEVEDFVSKTGVDSLAISIGTSHCWRRGRLQ